MTEQAPFTIPIYTSSGEYYIQLRTAYPENIVSAENVALFENCTIYDIMLGCKQRKTLVDMEAMNKIGSELQKVLEVNPNIILFFLCDFNAETIRINKTNKSIPPEEYRSRLFSNLFDRRMKQGNPNNFRNKVHVVPYNGDNYYLHLIFPDHLKQQAEVLKLSVDEMPK